MRTSTDLKLSTTSPITLFFFFLNDTATPEISTLPLHDALPISLRQTDPRRARPGARGRLRGGGDRAAQAQLHRDGPVPPGEAANRPRHRRAGAAVDPDAAALAALGLAKATHAAGPPGGLLARVLGRGARHRPVRPRRRRRLAVAPPRAPAGVDPRDGRPAGHSRPVSGHRDHAAKPRSFPQLSDQ